MQFLSFRSRFEQWLPPAERPTFFAAALTFGALAAAALIARATGTGLFVAAWGAENMPYLYLGSAVFVLLAASAMVWLLARWPVELLLQRLSLAVAGLVAVIWIVALIAPRPAAIAAFLAADLTAQLLVALFWALASLLFDPRQSRRLLAPLGAAGTVACILGGAAVAPTAEHLGTENLLWGVVALLVMASLASRSFSSRRPSALQPGALSKPGLMPALRSVIDRPLARSIGLLVAISAATLLIVDYVFVQQLGATTGRDGFAAYYGSLYSRANLGALAIQLFLATPLLRLGGVQLGLAVLPVSLLITSGFAVATGSFGWIALAKAHEPLFLFTFHAIALQMLYHGVAVEVRDRVRAGIDGILRPATVVVTGLLLLLVGPRVSATWLLASVPVLALVWIFSTRLNVRRYLDGLVVSLQSRRLDAQVTPLDAETLRVLREHWRSSNATEQPYLLALTQELGATEIIGEIAEDFTSLAPNLRARALTLVERSHESLDEDAQAIGDLEHYCLDQDPEVQHAALRLMLKRSPATVIGLRLTDAEDTVSNTQRLELAAAQYLATLGTTSDTKLEAGSDPHRDRIPIARLLDLAEADHAAPMLADALCDDDLELRRTALGSFTRRPVPELLALVLPSFEEPTLISATEAAVRAVGLDRLAACVAEHPGGFEDLGPGEHRFLRLTGESRDPSVFRFLRERFEDATAQDVRMIARALNSSASSLAKNSVERTWARLAARKLLRLAADLKSSAHPLRAQPELLLVVRSVDEEIAERSAAALWLVSTGYDLPIDGDVMLDDLTGTDRGRRAAVYEMLETGLDRATRGHVDALFGAEQKVAWPPEPERIQVALSELATLDSVTPPTRGSALLALHSVNPVRATELAVAIGDVPDPSLQEVLRWVLRSSAAEGSPIHRMATMIAFERAAQLGQVDLFKDLQPSVLADLAELSTERVLAAGEGLFAEGDVARSMYLIASGTVKVHSGERTLAELEAGDHLGEMSLLDDETRSASVTALTDCVFIRIRRDDFRDLLADHYDASLAVMKSLSARLRVASATG